jgi:hypothetical protein
LRIFSLRFLVFLLLRFRLTKDASVSSPLSIVIAMAQNFATITHVTWLEKNEPTFIVFYSKKGPFLRTIWAREKRGLQFWRFSATKSMCHLWGFSAEKQLFGKKMGLAWNAPCVIPLLVRPCSFLRFPLRSFSRAVCGTFEATGRPECPHCQ